ncbi:DNA polymerase subunit gamma-2 [Plodia interpunctella]|uniref:DNA polymerase subunit gamma-2 n=1 Tax=Plodia interpunctella TaxID=58824 RepID=UPI0023676F8C|nr:DNA polymerase subunit gamma-2, mitochondrial [Plodia interpunctella]
MTNNIRNILKIRNFFRILETKECTVRYIVEKPGRLLMQNIYCNWLRYINTKTSKYMNLFSDIKYFQETKKISLPVGCLNCTIPDFNNNITIEYNLSEYTHVNNLKLDCNIYVPKQDVMQYFIQWQRYRKFWWSSITTTPSLFAINDIKYDEDSAEVDIVAKYPWGQQIVETVKISPSQLLKNSSCLNCSMSLEGALLYILQDAQTNQNKEQYLRLHRKMAPYKISFALKCEESKDKTALQELAKLLHLRLNMRNISSWPPDWSHSSESQINENLHMGVTYTAVLSQKTLENGIFHLLNSSTMLKEEVHLADFDDYATLLFSN